MQRSFKRDLSSLEPLFEFTGNFARTHRLADTIAFVMNLAVEELFTNMVKYGGGDDRVFVALDVLGDDLVIELVHRGADAFDPTTAAPVDPTLPLAARKPGGLGLQLVRSVMDLVDFEHRDGAARVTATKHMGPRTGGA